jgi:hypothetical protein
MSNIRISESMSGDSLDGSKFIPSWESGDGGGEPTADADWSASGKGEGSPTSNLFHSADELVPVDVEENLWGAPPPLENLWSTKGQQNTQPEGPKCPIHVGKDCKKGICKALSDMLKKEEREKKELNKNKNKNAKNWNKKNNRYQKCMSRFVRLVCLIGTYCCFFIQLLHLGARVVRVVIRGVQVSTVAITATVAMVATLGVSLALAAPAPTSMKTILGHNGLCLFRAVPPYPVFAFLFSFHMPWHAFFTSSPHRTTPITSHFFLLSCYHCFRYITHHAYRQLFVEAHAFSSCFLHTVTTQIVFISILY